VKLSKIVSSLEDQGLHKTASNLKAIVRELSSSEITAGFKKIKQYFRLMKKEIEEARNKGWDNILIGRELTKMGFKPWAIKMILK